MIKKTLLIIAFLLLCVCSLTACKKVDDPGILFSNEPISLDNPQHFSRQFNVGERIYYLFYTPEKIETEFIRVQVFKTGSNVPVGGYSIVWSCDYRVMKQNLYYYYNNFVLHSPGRYVMQVFSVDNLAEPLAWNFFYVN